jgi:copper resistance protein B
VNKWPLLFLLGATAVGAAEHDHSAMQASASAVTNNQHEHDAAQQDPAALNAAIQRNLHEHGGMLNSLLMVDRLEQQQRAGDDLALWEAQAWYGGDYHKLWVKTEGEHRDDAKHAELQALYSRAVAPYWDVQAGLRHDDGSAAAHTYSRSYAVFGLQGLAPYWFEVDSALFLSEHGDLSVRVETEYELNLTQRLLLQPRLALNHAFAADVAAGAAQGITDSSIGLRLRYEFIREFAPYVGVEWSLGKTGKDDDEHRVVAGVRFWY